MRRSTLLTIDGIINLVLGTLLIIFSDGWVRLLGVPPAANAFYANILGGSGTAWYFPSIRGGHRQRINPQ